MWTQFEAGSYRANSVVDLDIPLVGTAMAATRTATAPLEDRSVRRRDVGVDQTHTHGLTAAAGAAVRVPLGQGEEEVDVAAGPLRLPRCDRCPVRVGAGVGAWFPSGEAGVGYSQVARQPQLGAELWVVGDGLG